MSSSPDSSSVSGSDDSDLDDTPLFIPSMAAPTPRVAPASFSLRSLPAAPLAPVPESPPVSAQKQQEGSGAAQQKPQLPGLALKGIATPDLSEPLPSSRTANPDAPRLSLTPRLNLSMGSSSNGLAANRPHSAEDSEAPSAEDARHDSQHASTSGMLTARVSKPNLKLQLADPASASPVPSPLRPRNTMSLSKANGGAAGYAPTSSSSQIVASLISTAFAVPRQQAHTSQSGNSTTGTEEEHSEGAGNGAGSTAQLLDMVAQRCTAGLGVAREELRFFDLREISPDEALPQNVSNIGVMVNNSAFSLSALEDVLAQNKQLQATQQTNATTISSMYADTRALTSSNTEKEVKIMEQEKDLAMFKERLRTSESDKAALQDHNEKLAARVDKLTSTLQQLKAEFMRMQTQQFQGAGMAAGTAGRAAG